MQELILLTFVILLGESENTDMRQEESAAAPHRCSSHFMTTFSKVYWLDKEITEINRENYKKKSPTMYFINHET